MGKYNIHMDGIRHIQASFSSSFQLTPSFLQVRAASRMRRSFMLRCVTIASMAFKSLADEDQKSEETGCLIGILTMVHYNPQPGIIKGDPFQGIEPIQMYGSFNGS